MYITGLLYKCPPRFAYSEKERRCVLANTLPKCERVPQATHTRLSIETATPLYPHDLNWFFNSY